MKKNSAFLVVLALAMAACTMEASRSVKVEIPGVPEVRLDQIQEIILTNVWQEKEVKDFNLSQDLIQYFQDELKQPFKGTVSIRTIPWDSADLPKNKEFWKRAGADGKKALFLAGRAMFSEEVRKALLASEKRAIDDGPFAKEKTWAQRKTYSLKLELFLINADDGEVFFQKDYLETANYPNIKQTAEFAFYDLLQRIKTKLFRSLFSGNRIQDRYLLLR